MCICMYVCMYVCMFVAPARLIYGDLNLVYVGVCMCLCTSVCYSSMAFSFLTCNVVIATVWTLCLK